MSHSFDQEYWRRHWREAAPTWPQPPNPYLAHETGDLVPGTALDAGCGTGAEAIWLALHGWQVTAADISAEALSRAGERARESGVAEGVRWVEADLGGWDPGRQFDLVTCHYVHTTMPPSELYERIAAWVAPHGTLLVVGHLHAHDVGGRGVVGGGGEDHEQPPAEASGTAAAVAALLDETAWEVVTADQGRRAAVGHDGQRVALRDFVVRARRRA